MDSVVCQNERLDSWTSMSLDRMCCRGSIHMQTALVCSRSSLNSIPFALPLHDQQRPSFWRCLFGAILLPDWVCDQPEVRLAMIGCSCCLCCLRSALVRGAAGRDIVARLLLQRPHAAGSEPVFLDGSRVGKQYQVVSVRYMRFLFLSS